MVAPHEALAPNLQVYPYEEHDGEEISQKRPAALLQLPKLAQGLQSYGALCGEVGKVRAEGDKLPYR